MLKDVTDGVTRLFAGRGRKPINLALQGGGAHGAFTWGVLDHLLDDGRIQIAGISGTSAGAMNAVMVADGFARGGPEEARKRLAEFWRAASLGGHLPGPQRAVMDRLLSLFPFNASPMQMMVDAMARYLSPYDVNPLNINPLKDLIERFVDFEAIRSRPGPELFISATNVHSGRLRVFRREEMSADVVMASAALPLMFRAVEIDGEPYWDGGFTGNPAIIPLIEANDVDDVLVVQISPLSRETTPTSVKDILHRMNEITFNASLDSELRALEFIGRSTRDNGKRRAGGNTSRINVHRIVMEGVGKKLGAGSRLNTDYDFFALLHRAGKRAARRFLENHYGDIGRRSTMDLAEVAASA
jgi:NTE family protein